MRQLRCYFIKRFERSVDVAVGPQRTTSAEIAVVLRIVGPTLVGTIQPSGTGQPSIRQSGVAVSIVVLIQGSPGDTEHSCITCGECRFPQQTPQLQLARLELGHPQKHLDGHSSATIHERPFDPVAARPKRGRRQIGPCRRVHVRRHPNQWFEPPARGFTRCRFDDRGQLVRGIARSVAAEQVVICRDTRCQAIPSADRFNDCARIDVDLTEMRPQTRDMALHRIDPRTGGLAPQAIQQHAGVDRNAVRIRPRRRRSKSAPRAARHGTASRSATQPGRTR